ncbi:hypothetical protein BGZ98_002218 [Dissophora globulifera]|nr:hypothetical protein BGZ98_002218 [Dissophora globulifera]
MILALVEEEDEILVLKIYSKLEQLSEADRLRRQLIVLYSDTLCPILKFHAELFSEIVRVLPDIIDTGVANTNAVSSLIATGTSEDVSDEISPSPSPHANVLALVVSPKSDTHVKVMLPEPFYIDLFDRMHMIDIQVKNTHQPLQQLLVVDNTWAALQVKNSPPTVWQNADVAREHYVRSLLRESERLGRLLDWISATSELKLGTLELVCVIDQSEAELYGVPVGIRGKVIFLVTLDRQERPKSVALKTSMHWIDRIFQRADYSLDWIHANVIPLYLELPESPGLNVAGQRLDSVFPAKGVHVSAKRPSEAYVRVKVRQGEGAEVLEPSVLNEIERTKLFEMQAIRKPYFAGLMERMSQVGWAAAKTDMTEHEHAQGEGAIAADENPFL